MATNLPSPPRQEQNVSSQQWKEWLFSLYDRVKTGPFQIHGYTVSNLPAADLHSDGDSFSSLVFVSDETGGATLAYSDGTNWRRVQDRAIVS